MRYIGLLHSSLSAQFTCTSRGALKKHLVLLEIICRFNCDMNIDRHVCKK